MHSINYTTGNNPKLYILLFEIPQSVEIGSADIQWAFCYYVVHRLDNPVFAIQVVNISPAENPLHLIFFLGERKFIYGRIRFLLSALVHQTVLNSLQLMYWLTLFFREYQLKPPFFTFMERYFLEGHVFIEFRYPGYIQVINYNEAAFVALRFNLTHLFRCSLNPKCFQKGFITGYG